MISFIDFLSNFLIFLKKNLLPKMKFKKCWKWEYDGYFEHISPLVFKINDMSTN